ncbi:uncharacterized protein LOC142101239 [Mixophyes fleayi]|uniref:uncharacterized protein LOC142101239 n=1 Tax=Mixophyes fleayi TaxID=3061075 RepID=UPI003F4DE036
MQDLHQQPERMDPAENFEILQRSFMREAAEYDDLPSTSYFEPSSQSTLQISGCSKFSGPERREPVEDDERHQGTFMREATKYDTNVETLRSGEPYSDSETISYRDLQISDSNPLSGPGFQWSPDVLSVLSNLSDFSPEEATALIPLLGPPGTTRPLHVRDYLLAFQKEPGYHNRLRMLTQQLKSLGRGDVVKALHQDREALRWLGPVLPEEHLVKDIVPSLWEPLTTALSVSHPGGHDWRLLAEHLKIPRGHIDLWQQREKNPAEVLLRTWQVKVSQATVGRLFDLLIDNREDLAAML